MKQFVKIEQLLTENRNRLDEIKTAFGMLLQHNVIFLLTGIGILVVIPSSVVAQVNNNNTSGWTTHTLEKCKVSFEYPSNWILMTKKSPFDTNMTSEIEIFNPDLDLSGHYPAFEVGACPDLEIMKQQQRASRLNPFGQLLSNESIRDAKTLSMFIDSLLSPVD